MGQGHCIVLCFALYFLFTFAMYFGEYAVEKWPAFDHFLGIADPHLAPASQV